MAYKKTIAVIGLGYVGLPLAVAFAEHGDYRVLGYDISLTRLSELVHRKDSTGEVSAAALENVLTAYPGEDSPPLCLLGTKTFLPEADVFIVTVPTPVGAHGQDAKTYS